MHSLVIVYVAVRLHLNKVMALLMQNICVPPFVPVLCIEIGHYALHKKFLTQVSIQTVFKELPSRAYEWLIGSLALGPILAIICAAVVYYGACAIQRKNGQEKQN